MEKQLRKKPKLHYIKQICIARNTINKMKKLPTELEKIFANFMYDKGLISKVCKELIQLNSHNNKTKAI